MKDYHLLQLCTLLPRKQAARSMPASTLWQGCQTHIIIGRGKTPVSLGSTSAVAVINMGDSAGNLLATRFPVTLAEVVNFQLRSHVCLLCVELHRVLSACSQHFKEQYQEITCSAAFCGKGP